MSDEIQDVEQDTGETEEVTEDASSQEVLEDVQETEKSVKSDVQTSEEIKRRDAQIKHWRKKYDDLKSSPNESFAGDPARMEKLELRASNPDKRFSDDEVDLISSHAETKSIPLSEAAKQLDSYIQFERQKVVETNKVPAPSGSASSASGTSIPPDMPQHEVDKVLRERFERSQGEGRSGL